MSCHELRLHITALLDTSLEPELVNSVQEHLAVCPLCARFYEQQQELNRCLETGMAALEPPREMWQKIHARLAEPSRPRWAFSEFFQLPGWRYAAAALAVLLFLSTAVLNLEEPDRLRQQILTRLDSYELNVKGNPFWPGMPEQNPFFDFAPHQTGNPFADARSSKSRSSK